MVDEYFEIQFHQILLLGIYSEQIYFKGLHVLKLLLVYEFNLKVCLVWNRSFEWLVEQKYKNGLFTFTFVLVEAL